MIHFPMTLKFQKGRSGVMFGGFMRPNTWLTLQEEMAEELGTSEGIRHKFILKNLSKCPKLDTSALRIVSERRYKTMDDYLELLTKIPLFIGNIAGESGMLIVDGVFPYYAYVDGTRSNTVLGFTYRVVSPYLGYAKLSVKVPSSKKTPVVTMEEIKSHSGPLYCHFNGFQAKFYRNGTALRWTASAEHIEISENELNFGEESK